MFFEFSGFFTTLSRFFPLEKKKGKTETEHFGVSLEKMEKVEKIIFSFGKNFPKAIFQQQQTV